MIETGFVAQTTPQNSTATRAGRDSKEGDTDIGEVFEYVKSYAKQETLGRFKGAGRWLAFGAAGAFALGLGLMIVLLGLLRLIQTEWDWARTSGSWLPYLIVLVVTVVVLVVTLQRIKKDHLNKEPS